MLSLEKMTLRNSLQYDHKMVDFVLRHYTYRMFPPAIDIIPTLLAVAYSIRKYTNKKMIKECSYNMLWRQPPPLHHELESWEDPIQTNFHKSDRWSQLTSV